MIIPGRNCVALTSSDMESPLAETQLSFQVSPSRCRSAHRCRVPQQLPALYSNPTIIPDRATLEYRSRRGIRRRCGSASARGFAFGHNLLDFVGIARKARGEKFRACGRDQHVVFNAYAEIFFGNINSRLERDGHAGFERARRIAGIMHIESDVMAQSCNEVAAERMAFAILAVRIDVVVGDLIEAAGSAREAHTGFGRGERGILRA